MNKSDLLGLLDCISKSIVDRSKLYDSFQELLLAFIDEPMTTCEIAVFFQSKNGHEFIKEPLPIGVRPSDVGEIEIAKLQTVRGGGFRPLLVLSHGFHQNNATNFFVRGFDASNFFRAEWVGRAETARVSYCGTPANISELFTVEHDATTSN